MMVQQCEFSLHEIYISIQGELIAAAQFHQMETDDCLIVI